MKNLGNMMDLKSCNWINEPKKWVLEDEVLYVETNSNTDFWRETHYGFTRHSGHIFGYEIEGDFTFQLCIEGDYEKLYDQAGIMIELDSQRWCKAGIEFSDNEFLMSSVLTYGKSDWSTGLFQGNPKKFWMRATMINNVLRLQYSTDGFTWPLMRLCPFPNEEKLFVGAMCCTPEREGLKIRFSEFRLSNPLAKDLHDLS